MADGATEVLSALALAGMLGSAGQVVRALGGIKKLSDKARANGTRTFDDFSPSRFFVSLVIGFVAGMVAALSLDLMQIDFHNTQVLVGLAAAGYGGTDFLEAFGRNLAARSGASATPFSRIKKPAQAIVTRQPIQQPPPPPPDGGAKSHGSHRRSQKR